VRARGEQLRVQGRSVRLRVEAGERCYGVQERSQELRTSLWWVVADRPEDRLELRFRETGSKHVKL